MMANIKTSTNQSLALRFAARGVLLSVLASAVPGLCQSNVTYQPSQRLRTALESCMKDEVLQGAYCIKKCQPNFRLDVKEKPPVCIATSAAARAPATSGSSPPAWVPPPRSPTKVPGA